MDASEAYTTFTGVTRLKQGITLKGAAVPEDEAESADSDTQLSRSMTVPAPSMSWEHLMIPCGIYLTNRDRQRRSDQSL